MLAVVNTQAINQPSQIIMPPEGRFVDLLLASKGRSLNNLTTNERVVYELLKLIVDIKHRSLCEAVAESII